MKAGCVIYGAASSLLLAKLVPAASVPAKFRDVEAGRDLDVLEATVAQSQDGTLLAPAIAKSNNDQELKDILGSGPGVNDETDGSPGSLDLGNRYEGWARENQRPLAGEISQKTAVVAEPSVPHQQQFPTLAAIAICIISLCVISFSALIHCRHRRRRRALTEKSILPSPQQSIRSLRQESRCERRARRKVRRQAAKEYMRDVFTHWAALTRSEPQAGDSGDSDSESQLSNTMEEEIASFRAAVDLVDSLVSAEEGRHRPPAPEYRGHTSYNGCFVIDDDTDSLPPPYESEDEMDRVMGFHGGMERRHADQEKEFS